MSGEDNLHNSDTESYASEGLAEILKLSERINRDIFEQRRRRGDVVEEEAMARFFDLTKRQDSLRMPAVEERNHPFAPMEPFGNGDASDAMARGQETVAQFVDRIINGAGIGHNPQVSQQNHRIPEMFNAPQFSSSRRMDRFLHDCRTAQNHNNFFNARGHDDTYQFFGPPLAPPPAFSSPPVHPQLYHRHPALPTAPPTSSLTYHNFHNNHLFDPALPAPLRLRMPYSPFAEDRKHSRKRCHKHKSTDKSTVSKKAKKNPNGNSDEPVLRLQDLPQPTAPSTSSLPSSSAVFNIDSLLHRQ